MYFGPYCVYIDDVKDRLSPFRQFGMSELIGICYTDLSDGLHPYMRYLAAEVFNGTASSNFDYEVNEFDNEFVFNMFLHVYRTTAFFGGTKFPGLQGFEDAIQNVTESLSNA
jgi:hypothetical protein